MKTIKFAQRLMLLLVLYYLVYNTYFGWNMRPINEAEKVCDNIFLIGIWIAFAIFTFPLIDLYKYHVEKMEKKTKKKDK
jgi:hypothetical protein